LKPHKDNIAESQRSSRQQVTPCDTPMIVQEQKSSVVSSLDKFRYDKKSKSSGARETPVPQLVKSNTNTKPEKAKRSKRDISVTHIEKAERVIQLQGEAQERKRSSKPKEPTSSNNKKKYKLAAVTQDEKIDTSRDTAANEEKPLKHVAKKVKALREAADKMSTSFISAHDKYIEDEENNDENIFEDVSGRSSRPTVGKQFVPPGAAGQKKERTKSIKKDARLKNVDESMIELIRNEIMGDSTVVKWDDICGLEHAKKVY
jgi:hypothetical protein